MSNDEAHERGKRCAVKEKDEAAPGEVLPARHLREPGDHEFKSVRA
jgi:hypothetical protein